MEQKRFTQPCYPTVHFSQEILVECPKCTLVGVVKTTLPKYTLPFPRGYKSTFNCSFCSYKVHENDTKYGVGNDTEKWMGYMQGYINQRCGYCGHKTIFYYTKPTKKLFESVQIKCPSCNKIKAYPLTWYRYRNDKPTDPYLGLNLYIQINIKDHILWAYNIEHLAYIQDYSGRFKRR